MSDTTELQSRINAGGVVELDAREYVLDALDCTCRHGLTIRGKGSGTTTLKLAGPAKNLLDFTGAGVVKLESLRIDDGGHANETLVLLAQTAAYGQDCVKFSDVRIDARASSKAGLFMLSLASSGFNLCQFYSYNGAPACIITGNNFWGASSDWQTVAAPELPSDLTFTQCEMHNLGGFGNLNPPGFACWIGGAQSCRWMGGNMSANGGHKAMSVNAVALGGDVRHPNRLLFLGTTFYTDDGSIFPDYSPALDPSIPRGIDFNVAPSCCRFVEC